MKFTVITTTYNCKDKIKKTFDSVVNQQLGPNADFEYIIQDGLSTDGTTDEVNRLKETLPADVSKKIIIYSEEDKGIYDAMNKAVKKAAGDYIVFLGAGDYFYTDDVLLRVNAKAERSKPDVLYGYVYTKVNGVVKKDKRKVDLKYTFRIMPICHQAIFGARKLFDEKQFNTNYPIVADQDWLMYMVKNHKKVKYINIPVSYYEETGFGNTNPVLVKEAEGHFEEMHTKYFGKRRKFYQKLRKIILGRS